MDKDYLWELAEWNDYYVDPMEMEDRHDDGYDSGFDEPETMGRWDF